MTPTPYTEDTLVQQTTAEYLETRLGWDSVYAYNAETFGPDGTLGRDSDKEVVLTRSFSPARCTVNWGGNFTFVILTDRDDLDTQIYKTFAGCNVVDNDRDPCRASSGRHLSWLLAEHKGYVFSLIQKFNQEMHPEKGYTDRNDVIVITDEAHRTQYGTLALNLRNGLPNASYIGFTGTPLFSNDEITRRVFGNYISTYDFQRAVEDKATVPLYYDARGDKLGLAVGDLNTRIAEKLEELETDDIDVEQRLQKELKRDYHIITAKKRLDQIARDFVLHYSRAWETGRSQMGAPNV